MSAENRPLEEGDEPAQESNKALKLTPGTLQTISNQQRITVSAEYRPMEEGDEQAFEPLPGTSFPNESFS